MYEFIVSGIETSGRRRYEVVEATDGDHAVNQFAGEGFSDVILHSDDLRCIKNEISAHLKFFSAKEMVLLTTAGRFLAWWITSRALLRKMFWIMVIALMALVGFWLIDDEFPTYAGVLCVVAVSLPWLIAALLFTVGPTGRLRRLQEAFGWGKWKEVLQLASGVRSRGAEADLAVVRATALAALGRMEESAEAISEIDDPAVMPRPMFWGHLAAIRMQTGDSNGAFDAIERALEYAPGNVALRAFQAAWYARINDLESARRIMAKLEHRIWPHPFWATRLAIQGIFAAAERRYDDAVDKLSEARDLFQAYARGNPANRLAVALTQARLAAALYRTGDRDSAMAEYAVARPVLLSNRMDDQIDEVDRIVGWEEVN